MPHSTINSTISMSYPWKRSPSKPHNMISKFMNIRPAHNITFKFMNGNVQWCFFNFPIVVSNFWQTFWKKFRKISQIYTGKKIQQFPKQFVARWQKFTKKNKVCWGDNLGSVYVFGKISCASNKNEAQVQRLFWGKKMAVCRHIMRILFKLNLSYLDSRF